MAWAICKNCGCPVSWPAKRGHRLKDYQCPKCGGRLRRATQDEANQAMAKHGGYYDYYIDKWISLEEKKRLEEKARIDWEKILRGGVIIIK